ncbi:helix-turn-helix domain-containing protein [Sphingomonas solaris]|uniref:Helix-turn-helix domain-containing protein n=1 Tax=Alterirhizorhabdus solaris TaxID=2529389 RepID=A0A558RBM0_9SPHN|nr:helix-turn-helix domain-containing protein [Sphingomonas solaris]TVV76662.1 helix-turn-helix domain-containing protein [Sphingomonas solaris]
MTQLSAPVARAVAVLNFLAGHPEQAFTLTEIAKTLRLSSATCHNLLAALVEAGYAYRTAGKTYVLGPALARVAQASLAPAIIMQVARPEMRLLADEFDVVCSAYHLVDNEVVVRERASAVSHITWNAPYIRTVPVAAPLGREFVTGTEAVFDAWLDTADPPLEPAYRVKLHEAQRFLCARGFTFATRTVPLVDRETARSLQYQAALTDYTQAAIDPAESYQLAYVAAPVFSRPGLAAFGLSLAGFTGPVTGDRIDLMGERLRAACDRIGAFIAGRELR